MRVRKNRNHYPIKKDVKAGTEGAISAAGSVAGNNIASGLGAVGGLAIGAIAGSNVVRKIKNNKIIKPTAIATGVIAGGAIGNILAKRAMFYTVERRNRRKR